MSNALYAFLSIFTTLLALLLSLALVSLNSSGQASEVPYTVIEAQGNAQGLARALEEQGALRVLWRGSVQIPVSAFDRVVLENLADIWVEPARTGAALSTAQVEQFAGESAERSAQFAGESARSARNISSIAELEAAFRHPQSGAELLYVFGDFRSIERALALYRAGASQDRDADEAGDLSRADASDSAGASADTSTSESAGNSADAPRSTSALNSTGAILYAHNQFRLFGLVFFAIFSLILLVFFKNRKYSLLCLLTFSPLFFIPSTFIIGISAVIVVSARNCTIRVLGAFKKDLNAQSAVALPKSKRGAFVVFMRSLSLYSLRLDRLIFIEIVVLALSIAFLRYFEALVTLALIPFAVNLIWVEMKFIIITIRDKDHSLFYASQIVPSWNMPLRSERAGLFACAALIITAPLLFAANSSNARSMETSILGSLESNTDVDRLRMRITSLLNEHIYQNIYREDRQSGGEAARADGGGDSGVAQTGGDGQTAGGAAQPAADIAPPPAYSPVHILLADRAYQEIFPYLSLSSAEGAGQYSEGAISLTRFRQEEGGLRAYQEIIFQVTNEWIASELSLLANYDMLRLYSTGGLWYTTHITNSSLSSPLWVVIEIIVFVFLTLPWLVTWQPRKQDRESTQGRK